jgi:hypothetical protein
MVYEMQDRLERMRKHKTPRITSSPFDNGRVFPYPVR